VSEVRHTRCDKGSRVSYGLWKRSDAGGVLRVASKWSWGVLASVTNRFQRVKRRAGRRIMNMFADG